MMLPCRKIEGKKNLRLCSVLYCLFCSWILFFEAVQISRGFFFPSENSIIIVYSFVLSVLKLEAHDLS